MKSDSESHTAEQAGTEPASEKPSVPPMAPFRLALEKIDAEIAAGWRLVEQEWDSNRQVSDMTRHRTQGLQDARSILVEAMKEAASHGEARKPTA